MTRRKKFNKFGKCPACGCNWDGGKIIDVFKAQREAGTGHVGMTDKEIKDDVRIFYGPPYRFSKIIGIYDRGLDRTVEYQCPECHARWSVPSYERV